jgi:division protein CdvB (Snf7/Vps24/ESCRT-III family)
MSSERPRPKITGEAARILRAAARVAECRLKERFPEKRRT